MTLRPDGWWGLTCWNGLSPEQQRQLVEVGTLEIGYHPEGRCPNGAHVAIEMQGDKAPGPRFYCLGCALDHLQRTAGGG
jgi:hypothetical protein